jgi:hypothetical protein
LANCHLPIAICYFFKELFASPLGAPPLCMSRGAKSTKLWFKISARPTGPRNRYCLPRSPNHPDHQIIPITKSFRSPNQPITSSPDPRIIRYKSFRSTNHSDQPPSFPGNAPERRRRDAEVSPGRNRLLRNSAQITGWQDDSNGKGAVNGCKRSSVRSESGN